MYLSLSVICVVLAMITSTLLNKFVFEALKVANMTKRANPKHIAKRGVRLMLSGACVQKKIDILPSLKAEVSRLGGNTQALCSLTQKTPATVTA